MNGQQIAGNVGSSLSSLGSIPKVELPKVGDTLTLFFNNYNGIFLVKEGQPVTSGVEYVEVEVKAIKKAKVSFE